jgi:RNA polymerase sigma-70 factor (ECF subfamily)
MKNEIIEAAQTGNMQAFNQIYLEFAPSVYGWVYRLVPVKADAEDLLQEIFLKVFQKIKTFSFQSAFKTWLYRLAVNSALNRIQQNKKYFPLDSALELPDRGPPHAEIIENRDLAKKLLDALDEEQRIAVILADILDLDYTEIAEILVIPVGTLKSRLARSRERMRTVAQEMHLDLSKI